jgi:hypothetical protein
VCCCLKAVIITFYSAKHDAERTIIIS